MRYFLHKYSLDVFYRSFRFDLALGNFDFKTDDYKRKRMEEKRINEKGVSEITDTPFFHLFSFFPFFFFCKHES